MSRSVAEARARARAAASGGLVPFVLPPLPLPESSKRRPRLPTKLHDRIIPNPLRPHVLAADRFTHWLTPYGIAKLDQASHLFPTHEIIRHCLTMANSVLPSTLSNYSSGLARFTKFCDDFRIPEEDRMPASELVLSMFISNRVAGSVSKSTMRTWTEGLRLWHIINDAPWYSGSALSHTLKVCIPASFGWLLTSCNRAPLRWPLARPTGRKETPSLSTTSVLYIATLTIRMPLISQSS